MAVADSPSKPPRRWRRRLLWIALVLLVLTVPPVAYFYYDRSQAADELAEAVAEIELLDPEWRLAEIERRRRMVPADKNSALLVKAARQVRPPLRNALEETDRFPPPVAFDKKIETALRAEVAMLAEFLDKARKIADHPHGRYPVRYAPGWVGTLIEEQLGARDVARALEFDVLLAVHDRRIDDAWRSTQAMLNCARSVGDDPFLMVQLIRMAIQSLTVQCLERTLAQCEVPAGLLADMQKQLSDEADENLSLIFLRGERAGLNHLYANAEAGEVSVTGTGFANGIGGGMSGVLDFVYLARIRRSHAVVLRTLTKGAQAAKLQGPERAAAFQAVRQELADFDRNIRQKRHMVDAVLWSSTWVKGVEAEQRQDTRLNCAIAGLAAERFRLSKKRWPASLEELVTEKLLPHMPQDLFANQPLRFRTTKDGLVLYSVSKEGNYAGDALDDLKQYDSSRLRVEFRLWNPAQRRQPQ